MKISRILFMVLAMSIISYQAYAMDPADVEKVKKLPALVLELEQVNADLIKTRAALLAEKAKTKATKKQIAGLETYEQMYNDLLAATEAAQLAAPTASKTGVSGFASLLAGLPGAPKQTLPAAGSSSTLGGDDEDGLPLLDFVL